MDTQRLILWLIFSFSALMLWQAWERDRNPPVAPVTAPATRPGDSSGAPTAAMERQRLHDLVAIGRRRLQLDLKLVSARR